jgi:tetratricopeptide (TPR) repeat protein
MNKDAEAHIYFEIARKELSEYLHTHPDDSRVLSSLGIALAGLGRKDQALKTGLHAVELLPVEREIWRGGYRLEDLAHIYVMTGEYDRAIDLIEKLLSLPSDLSVSVLRVDPKWDPLQEHRRFKSVIDTNISIE